MMATYVSMEGRSMATGEPAFNENDMYDRFPRGDETGFGPAEGFNTWVRINDAQLFTEAALGDPAVRAFVDAPFEVNYAQFKSSQRETEYFIHKPVEAMTGQVEGIGGTVGSISGEGHDPTIATLVVNHERSLAFRITRSLVISGDGTAGQMIHKET
jgi:hypothetical protein